MYTEEEEYEEYKSWREDIEFMDRYMDTLESLLDEEIRIHNQSLVEDERRKQDNTLSDDNEITRVSVRFTDEDLWLTQNQLAEIYQTTQ